MAPLTEKEIEILGYAPEWAEYYHLIGELYLSGDLRVIATLQDIKGDGGSGKIVNTSLDFSKLETLNHLVSRQQGSLKREVTLLEGYSTLTDLVTLWESNSRSLYSFCGDYLTFGDLADYYDTGTGVYFKEEVVPKTKLEIARDEVQTYLDSLNSTCKYDTDKPEAIYYDFEDFLGKGADMQIEDFVELCGIVYNNMKD